MIRVSSVDLQRNLSRYREIAENEPVIVTSYNKDQVVMISADLYDRLTSEITSCGAEPYDCDRYARAYAAHMALKGRRQAYTRLAREDLDFLECMFTVNLMQDMPVYKTLEIGGYVIEMYGVNPTVTGLSPFVDTFSKSSLLRFQASIRDPFQKSNYTPPYAGQPDLESARLAGFLPALLGFVGKPDEVADWMMGHVLRANGSMIGKEEFAGAIKEASLKILKGNRELVEGLDSQAVVSLKEMLL